jgi:hypothetical protein
VGSSPTSSTKSARKWRKRQTRRSQTPLVVSSTLTFRINSCFSHACARVAQLVEASDLKSDSCEFKSHHAHQSGVECKETSGRPFKPRLEGSSPSYATSSDRMLRATTYLECDVAFVLTCRSANFHGDYSLARPKRLSVQQEIESSNLSSHPHLQRGASGKPGPS